MKRKNGDTGEAQYRDKVASAVSAAGEQEMRKFLIRILQEDEKLFERFQSAACCGSSSLDISGYEKKVDRVIKGYLGRSGFIPYQEAGSFVNDMAAFLDSDVEMMLEDENYAQAFALSAFIFLKAGSVEIDDSDGGLGMLLERCADIWEQILECAGKKVRRQIFEWLTGHLDDGAADYMEECLERVLLDAFTGGEEGGGYTTELLDYTKRKAMEEKEGADCWNSGYYVQKWALYHIRLMEQAGLGQEEILNYCKEYWKYPKIRQYYIEACMQQKLYDKAIDALQESIQMDAGLPGQVRLFSARLKEAYRVSGRMEDYQKQLWKLVTQDDAGNLEDFKELRSLYSEQEWKEVREEIFQALPPHAQPQRLYQEEGMYDRLLEYVLQEKGLYELQKYQGVLEKEYARQILDKYEKELNEMAARAADRRRYHEWAALLRKMSGIEGGAKKVHEIVADWRVRYKNRPAMIEELKQFG